VEFEPDRVMAAEIHDANMDIHGRATFEPLAEGRTLLTMSVDVPALNNPEKIEFMSSMMQRSVDNMKRLLETENATEET
jgi:hypothetical protein